MFDETATTRQRTTNTYKGDKRTRRSDTAEGNRSFHKRSAQRASKAVIFFPTKSKWHHPKNHPKYGRIPFKKLCRGTSHQSYAAKQGSIRPLNSCQRATHKTQAAPHCPSAFSVFYIFSGLATHSHFCDLESRRTIGISSSSGTTAPINQRKKGRRRRPPGRPQKSPGANRSECSVQTPIVVGPCF